MGETVSARPADLYRQALGHAFLGLPAPVRDLRSRGPGLKASGEARVDGAANLAGRLVALLAGFPRPAARVPVSVSVRSDGRGGEVWTRDFGGKGFSSTLSPSPVPGRVMEAFGPMRLEASIRGDATGVHGMPVTRWWLGPVPLPRFLAPTSVTTEGADAAGRYVFDVDVLLPLGLGRAVRYRGWLVPDGDGADLERARAAPVAKPGWVAM